MPLSGGRRADVGFELVDSTTPGAELYVIGNIGVRAPGITLNRADEQIPQVGSLVDELEGTPFEPKEFQLRTADGRIIDLREGIAFANPTSSHKEIGVGKIINGSRVGPGRTRARQRGS